MISLLNVQFITGLLQAETQRNSLPWYIWLLIVALVLLLVWLLFRTPAGEEKTETTTRSTVIETIPEPVVGELPVEGVEPLAPVAEMKIEDMEDLTIIEGIGPKINKVLHEAGIGTFAALAVAEPATVKDILVRAGLTLADPGSWGDQARLAAEGKWDELKNLQEHLKGGRIAS